MWKKILIIEDEKMLNDMYALKFKSEWFEVEQAYEWLDWITKISSFRPDVVLLDIMMPWMNWYETLKVLKDQTSYDMKVIMFTNLNWDNNKKEAYDAWADWYLVKADTTPKMAVDIVNELFHSKSAEEKFEDELSDVIDLDIRNLKEWSNIFYINDSTWKKIELDIRVKL